MNADYNATATQFSTTPVPVIERKFEPPESWEMLPSHLSLYRDGDRYVIASSMGQGSRIQFDEQTPQQISRYSSGETLQAVTPPEPVQTVAEQVDLLRGKLALSISDIAALIGVTRPTVYSWLKNGQPQQESSRQLAAVASAARLIADLKLHRPDHVLKRPLFDGRSALDLLHSGQRLSEEQLAVLQQLDQREEAQRQAHAKGTPVRSLADTLGGSAPVMRS